MAQYQPESATAATIELSTVDQLETLKTVGKIRRRVTIQEDVFARLQAAALREGKPASQLANAAIVAYLNTLEQG